MSWRTVSLGDGIRIKHGFAFKSQYFSDDGKHIVLTPGNFHEEGGFRLRPGKDRGYTGDVPEDFILGQGALIVAMTEQAPGLLGSSALIPEDDRYLHNQRLGLVDAIKPDVFDKTFLYYLFNTRSVRHQISGSASGTKVRHTAPERIYRIKVRIPNTEAQRKIGLILRNYDHLIENNRRRFQLLEQAARLLYKEWFVRLRFPGHEHVKIKDGVPEGWSTSTVGEVCRDFSDGDWIETKDQGGEDYRLLQISNIGENDFVETGNYRYITEETFRRLRCRKVVVGDILISRMPKPIGRAWLVVEMPWRMVTAVDVTIAEPDTAFVNLFFYLYHLNSPGHLARCEGRATGATRPRISRKSMAGLSILLPPIALQNEFGEFAGVIHEMKARLSRQIDALLRARDVLLPRLMSGEIAV